MIISKSQQHFDVSHFKHESHTENVKSFIGTYISAQSGSLFGSLCKCQRAFVLLTLVELACIAMQEVSSLSQVKDFTQLTLRCGASRGSMNFG